MQHVLEKLAATNPASEIWWDSSPLIYGKWADGVLKSAPEDKRDLWSEQLSRLLDPRHGGQQRRDGIPRSYDKSSAQPAGDQG